MLETTVRVDWKYRLQCVVFYRSEQTILIAFAVQNPQYSITIQQLHHDMYDQISMFNSSGSCLSNDDFTISASLRDALVPRDSLVVCVPLTRIEFAIVPLELFSILVAISSESSCGY